MKIGDLVSIQGKVRGEIIDLLPNSAIIETGKETLIKSKHILEVAFSIGDRVYIRNTNKSFTITELYFSNDANCWKACMNEKTATGFHSNNTQTYFSIDNLEREKVLGL